MSLTTGQERNSAGLYQSQLAISRPKVLRSQGPQRQTPAFFFLPVCTRPRPAARPQQSAAGRFLSLSGQSQLFMPIEYGTCVIDLEIVTLQGRLPLDRLLMPLLPPTNAFSCGADTCCPQLLLSNSRVLLRFRHQRGWRERAGQGRCW